MFMKGVRLIINEDEIVDMKSSPLWFDLEDALSEFFATDERFSGYDVSVEVAVKEEWNKELGRVWFGLDILVINSDVIEELGGELAGQTRPAMAIVSFATESIYPELVMNNGVPEFYFVFNYAGNGITNSVTWQNDEDETTVEDIVLEWLDKRFAVEQ